MPDELKEIENMLRYDSSLAPAVIVAATWYIESHPDEIVPDWLHCLANDAGNNPVATFEEARLDYIFSDQTFGAEAMYDTPIN